MLSVSKYPILQFVKEIMYSLSFPDQFSVSALSHVKGKVKLTFDDMVDGYKLLSS